MGPLPFIYNAGVIKLLGQYLETQPSRHTFFIYGPYQSGKTRTLLHVSELYGQKGFLPINLDFSDAKSIEEIIGFGKLSIMRSISDHTNYLKNLTVNVTVKPKKNAKILTPEDLQLIQRKIASLPLLQEKLLAELDRSKTESDGLKDFFGHLEDAFDDFRPAVFIAGGQNLQQHCLPLYNAILSHAAHKDQYMDRIPLIIETSNAILKMKVWPPHFRLVEVSKVTDPYKYFVKDVHCFTRREMKRIMVVVGPHGGEIESVFEQLKIGYEIEHALKERVDNLKFIRDYQLYGTRFGQEVCKTGRKYFEQINSTEPFAPLVVNGYVYIDKFNNLVPANKIVQKYICKANP
ncbi:hypothetical protein TVAG_214880 [Trichomonas vaginalis G3]|uniref:ATPase domain-containing protein n=1 Tax=Trichomonas vaginalis (strain ATCC PRA-98 / G3) TaxID=412133 RepID=A2DK92_TRIV3|nr:P-loop containing nucleoside triphosphate hydrolases family [Trichomonas vaginalis G3]EAY19263.1 hypothetical protein TVAG_214880 [Trichomonas vaginalis G3]KAI5548571.1 P-loop containing nucleoside triphosphate hydrolases family [Trichomonas vaginalis G3]|eukprot:XP_001580249.1 hypothetical protein [Trichomonas vaginalis G3]